MQFYDDGPPPLVDANTGMPEFPPEAIRPGGFGAGAPGVRPTRRASGARYTAPAAGYSRLEYDDTGFSHPVHDFGSAPEPSSILKHNPWLAEKYGAAPMHQPHGHPYPGTPYRHPAAALSADADWPQYGRDFGLGRSHSMNGGDAGADLGFGDGGFGEHHFVGGFGNPPPEHDDTEPVIPPMPAGMMRPKSAQGYARPQPHSPGFGATAFDFGHAPPQNLAHTPGASSMTLAPGWDAFRRHSSSAGSTPHTTPLPLSAHHGYASGPRHQYKRPGDWRSDFVMPRKVGLGERLGLTRVLSVGKVFQGEGKHRIL